MKIAYFSDLHMEGNPSFISKLYNPPEADLAILAGDILPVDMLSEHKTDPKSRKLRKAADTFFEAFAQKYPHIVYVTGNHEAYNGDLYEHRYILSTYLAKYKNIDILNNGIRYINDYLVFGSTMWSDFNNHDHVSMVVAMNALNDYRRISKEGSPIIPEDTYKEHLKSKESLRKILKSYPHKKFIVVTHHAPSQKSVSENHKEDFTLNGAFVSNMDDFMGEQIPLWVHGHVHSTFDYVLNGTRVVCNPMGYIEHGEDTGFDRGKVIEI